MENKQKLVFAVNGERFEIPISDPTTTLLEFLRTDTPYRGAKLGCGEGGCGACAVHLSKYDPDKDIVEEFTVSSCLTLLCSINGCSVTTTEGLGNSKDGFHPIHQRMAGFHASQCGFCTPGMCMSLFSALVNADKTGKAEPPAGFSKLTMSEAERAVTGNLCRCTGYRPIVDACKSFAADVDMEDLGLNSFWRKGENVNVNKLPSYSSGSICTFPEFLKNEIKSTSDNGERQGSNDQNWFTPTSVGEFLKLIKSKEAGDGNQVKFVVGNTSVGIYKELDRYEMYIDLRQIPELLMIRKDRAGIEIGAAVTISKVIEALEEEIKGDLRTINSLVYKKIADHMNMIASRFIRNTASLGGNLIMAQRKEFASDIATILLGTGSSVNLQIGTKRVTQTLEKFLAEPTCNSKTLLLSIQIPSWSEVNQTKFLFETYRAAPRPLGNAVAYVNAAFLATVSSHEHAEDFSLEHLQLAFGAFGTKHAVRARKVEEFLVGKSITPPVLLEAFELLRATVVPEEGISHPAYRSSLAVGFLFDFLRPFIIGMAEPAKNMPVKSNGHCNVGEHLERPSFLISSKQELEIHSDHHPVGEPTKKVGAEIQASGEAVFVGDIPSPKDCLHGAFVYSKRPLARVKSIELTASERVVAVVSAKDIPGGGENVGFHTEFGRGTLFADGLTEFVGQALSLVVAETQKDANRAANQVTIVYDTENLEPPILSAEEAVKRSSTFEVPPYFAPKRVIGDISRGLAEADHRILSAEIETKSQYHFYMETQTALAIPDEDNCMVVYSSSQMPEATQVTIARCIGIPENNIRVITRRVGGGFGGKSFSAITVATACALAAQKLRRPVRMYLDRKTDMIMTGARHPLKVNYTVGFKSDGKITGLHVDVLIDAGIFDAISTIMPNSMARALKKYNWGSLSFDYTVCKTNLLSKQAMRAPGEVQGSFIAEAVIEHVASTLSMDADAVRERNLHTHESLKLFYDKSAGETNEYTLPLALEKLSMSAHFHDRVETVGEFNSNNRWRKRGISRVPVIYDVTLRPTPGKVSVLNDGSIVVEVGGIEIGQGLWTKVRQMTAFGLGLLWSDGSQNLLERVRVIQADTLSLVQGGVTGGSTTSESSCEAVRHVCGTLVERLKPLKEKLEEQMGSVSWDTLIVMANLQAVNLSASTLWIPESDFTNYLNYGAAVSEVEIDLLTGATVILRTDITYDCGRSLNPAVDFGQIEGAFVQGIGFFMLEDYVVDSDGLVLSDGTWTYKIPTVDTIPRQFNIELLNSAHYEKRVLSSKASGEPPLLLAVSVYCAIRDAIKEARKELHSFNGSDEDSAHFRMDPPATMHVVKELCGLDNVERYLQSLVSKD